MRLTDALTDDLRRAPWRGDPNPLAGHCYVAAEALYHRALDLGLDARPMFVRHEGAPHWFVVIDGWLHDPTAGQFATPVPYEKAKGKGFLTKEPSRRAQEVMRRMGWR